MLETLPVNKTISHVSHALPEVQSISKKRSANFGEANELGHGKISAAVPQSRSERTGFCDVKNQARFRRQDSVGGQQENAGQEYERVALGSASAVTGQPP